VLLQCPGAGREREGTARKLEPASEFNTGERRGEGDLGQSVRFSLGAAFLPCSHCLQITRAGFTANFLGSSAYAAFQGVYASVGGQIEVSKRDGYRSGDFLSSSWG